MADLQHFEIFNHFYFCLSFSNLRVIYISCREKGHMGFFIISEVVLKQLKNLKNSCLHNGGLKTEQNLFFCQFGGSFTQQDVVFVLIFLAKVLYYYSRYDFDSFKFFARVWALIGPTKGSKPNFSITCLAILRHVKKFGEK